MKETFEKAKMEIVEFETEDVITTSGGGVNTPFMPVSLDEDGNYTEY